MAGIGREIGSQIHPLAFARARNPFAKVLTVGIGIRGEIGVDRLTIYRQIGVIPIQLDLVPDFGRQGDSAGGQCDLARHGVVEVVTGTGMVKVTTRVWSTNLEVHLFIRQENQQMLHICGVVLCRTKVHGRVLAKIDDGQIGPAQEYLLKGAELYGLGANSILWFARTAVTARRHDRPKTCGVLCAARVAAGVIQIGQVQIMTKFMGKDAYATVLRLDGVVANPIAGIADLNATQQIIRRRPR